VSVLSKLHATLATAIEGQLSIALAASDIASAHFADAVKSMPGERLRIDAPTLSDISDDRFVLTGGYGETWPIPGLASVDVALRKVELTVSERNGSLTVIVRSAGELGAGRLAAQLQYETELGWKLALEGGGSAALDMGTLLGNVAAGAQATSFAALLDGALGRAMHIEDFSILFDPLGRLPTRVLLSLSTNAPWEIVPGAVSIEAGAIVDLRSLHDVMSDDLNLTSTNASIDASVTLGSRIYRVIVRPVAAGTWEIQFRSDDGFPDLQDLAALAGGSELGTLVENSLGAWGFDSLHLTEVTVGVNTDDRGLAYVYMEAELSVLSVPFELSLWLPAFGLSGRMSGGHVLRVRQLLERLAIAAPGMPDVDVTDLVLTGNPKAHTFSLSADVAENTRVTPIPALPALVLEDISFDLVVDADKGNSGSIDARLTIAGVDAHVTGILDDNFTFLGVIPRLALTDLVRALIRDAVPPRQIPNVLLTDIRFALTPGTDALSLEAVVQGHWRIASGDANISIDRIEMTMHRAASHEGASTAMRLRLCGGETTSLGEGVSISGFDLSFQLEHDGGWTVTGDVRANVFDTILNLSAAYSTLESRSAIVLSMAASRPVDVLALHDGARLLMEQLAIELGEAAYSIAGKGRFVVDGIMDLSGRLHAYRDGAAYGIAFQPDDAVVTIPLALDAAVDLVPAVELAIGDFTAGRGAAKTNGRRPWILEAAVSMQLRNIPLVVRKAFPLDRVDGKLRADGEAVSVVVHMEPPLDLPFPGLGLGFANGKKLTLGQPSAQVDEISLDVSNKPRLAASMVVGIPSALNSLFGNDAEGKPRFDLFAAQFRLSVGIGASMSLQLHTSPFKDVPFIQRDGRQWTDWHFGEYGDYSFQVPQFELRKGSWTASAGFERHAPLKLPLGPVKFLLREGGVPAAALSVLPDTLPIPGVDLRNEGLYDWVKNTLGENVVAEIDSDVAQILEQLSAVAKDAVGRLPLRMAEYFEWREKDYRSGIIDIAVDSVGGGTQFGFRVLDEGKPFKFLFPMLTGLPELVGVTLRRLSFGQKAGGGLAQLEIDGYFDRFDMPSLIAALAAGVGSDLSNRYILYDTKALTPTAAPVPIPIFYRHLGFEYRDLLGLEVEAHWYFPDPEPGLTDYLQLIASMLSFLTDADFRLSEKGLPEGLSPKLTIGKNFIKLPQYLGGAPIGLTAPLPALDVADSVARFLDFLKTGRLAYLIQAVPLEIDGRWIRVGSQSIRFGPLALSASWCITTEDEFLDRVLPMAKAAGKLPATMSDRVLTYLPDGTHARAGDKGFVVLLTGEVAIGPFGALAEFGIAFTGGAGFETAFRLSIEALDLSVQLGGHLQADQTRVAVDGSLTLKLRDRVLVEFGGMIAVSDRALEAGVRLQLTTALRLDGMLSIGKDGISLQGEGGLSWGYGGSENLQGSGRIDFTREGLILTGSGSIYGYAARLVARSPGKAAGASLSAQIEIDLPDFTRQFDQLLNDGIANARTEIEQASSDLSRALDSLADVDLNVNSLRQTVIRICDTALAEMNRRIGKLPTTVYRTITVNVGIIKVKRRVKIPGVNPRKEAQAKARTYTAKINKLKQAAQTDDRDQLASAITAALNDLVKNKSFTVRGRAITVITSGQVKELQSVRDNIHDWIQMLPEREGGVSLSQDHLDQVKAGVAGALAAIGDAVEAGTSDATPRIESINFQSTLGSVSRSEQAVEVRLTRNSRTTVHSVILDFNNPARSVIEVYEAFVDGLA